jgi:DNA-binding response OmpR family regulator
MRVLIVEDEERLATTVARGLRREGMAVDIALDGVTAVEKADANPYDVVVLDRDLPALHGDDVCRILVEEGADVRVLMLTAAGDVTDRVEGLSIGADDYLGKPFAFEELVARVRALARRTERPVQPVLASGDLMLDPAHHLVRRGDRQIDLTRKEFGVLEELLRAEGAVVSTETLLVRVWDEHADLFTNAVRVTVMNLRRKLGDPPAIETVIGVGYRL